ncbi:hypothetical protein TNCV_4353601 [Trichonephila clavipes]|nr:hypothetical protein TNCV_4353601 [Trichonephila clavipes]
MSSCTIRRHLQQCGMAAKRPISLLLMSPGVRSRLTKFSGQGTSFTPVVSCSFEHHTGEDLKLYGYLECTYVHRPHTITNLLAFSGIRIPALRYSNQCH